MCTVYLTRQSLGHLNVYFPNHVMNWFLTSCEICLRWVAQNATDDKSILVQVMACWPQATSHYLSRCWPRSMSPYGITKPQWVIRLTTQQNGHHIAGNIFIFDEKCSTFIQFSLKFIRKSPIDNKSALVLVTAWRQAMTLTNDDFTMFRKSLQHVLKRSISLKS